MQNENTILQKLENFIRKYYKNQLLKGGILSISLILIVFFTLSFAEYFGRFGTQTRTALFTLFALSCLTVLVWYIVRPLLGLFNVSRKFGIEEASRSIGNHFPEVKDKLLNTLQLQNDMQHNAANALLAASVEQKTNELKPIPFVNAISFQKNYRYVKFALIPALALLFILIVSPGFKKSSERVVNFNQHFAIEAPFTFKTDIDYRQFVQNETVNIPLELSGDKIPAEAYINLNGNRYKMKQNEKGAFFYEIKNIQKSADLFFDAGGFSSKAYKIDIALKPSLVGYTATVTYPKYLNIPSETIRNIGELSVPQGTIIEWKFNTRNVQKMELLPEGAVFEDKSNKISFKRRFMKSGLIKIKTSNEEVAQGDSVFYQINVIPDDYPSIDVERKNDSLSNKLFYFLGDIADDHGFTKLQFNYTYKKSADKEKQGKSGSLPVSINNSISNQSFYLYWNLNSLNVQAEDEIEYYFTVWDNDGVNGAKSARTQPTIYKAPSLKEIKEETEEANKQIKTSLAGAQSDASTMEKEIQSIEKMLTEKKNLDWNDKKKIQNMLDKQKELQEKIKNSIDKNLEKNLKEEEFKQQDESLLDKQKQLEKLLEDVLDEETKALMEKIQKLLNENKKDELQKEMENFKFSEKELSKQMDRMLELFKELELEKKLSETIDKLNEMAEDQKKLADEAKNTKGKDEELKQKQDELNKEFEDVKKDLEDIKKKNDELESPLGLKDKKDKGESISQKMQQGSQKMGQGKNKEAGESGENAAEEMKELADELQSEMEEAFEEQQEEDYQNLRQILENLVQLSFDQEKLMDGFKENRNYSPKYVELRQKQRKIKDETRLVEDSLLALSKRNLEIEHFVNEEIARINENLDKSLYYLGERYTNNALVHQQYAMTGYNNLALMLSESLKKMQEQMKANKQNKGKPKSQCKKPGSASGEKSGKPNVKAIQQMQQELAKQLEELQKGQKQGGKGEPTSKEFAEMAAKQEAIRKKLQDLERDLKKEGQGGSLGDLKKTQDLMDELEKDLYYKRLNNETFKKLNQIEIKLSEHEKAQREQEKDDKRSSNEGKDQERPIPPSIQKYLEEKRKETELIKNVSPDLNPYYQRKVKEYFGN